MSKKKTIKPRNHLVPLLINKGGAMKDSKKEKDKKKCRGKVDEE